MPDRVRGAVFDSLGARWSSCGSLPPIRVVDLFSGSGSMGLEALSRGASSCEFHELHRLALNALRTNVESLGAMDRCVIHARDAWTAVESDSESGPIELMFLDPPYRQSEDVTSEGKVRRFLRRLSGLARRPSLIVFHHEARIRYELDEADGWTITDRRRFGSNLILLLE